MNNKSLIKLKIGLLSFVGIVLLAFMIFVLSFKNDFFDFKMFNVNTKYKLVFNESYNIENIKSIDFDLINADATIKYSDTEQAKLEIYDKDVENVNVNNEDGVLSVNFKSSSTFCIGICYTNRKVVLYLPSSFSGNILLNSKSGDIDVDQFVNSVFNISTSSGDVNLSGAKDASVKTVSGDANVRNVNSLSIKTVSGSADLYDIFDVSGSSTSGDIEIFRLGNSINLSTVSGEIEIKSASINKNSELSTISGDVEIEGINRIYVNTSTVSGDVDVYNSDRTSLVELKIKTTSGDIEVR